MDQPIFIHRAGKKFQDFFEMNDFGGYSLKVHRVAELPLPSGKAIAGDPFGQRIQAPLIGEAAIASRRPVELCAVMDEGEWLPAILRWKLRDELATDWFLAVSEDVPQENVISLQENEFIGTECPSGWILLGDVDSYQEYLLQASPLMGKRPEALLEEAIHAQKTPKWAAVEIGGAQAVVAVDGGWKDGLFPAYWGVNAQGEIVELIIDFFILGM